MPWSSIFWPLAYLLANLALTIHNKWILSGLKFSFPWILSAIHIAVTGIGAYTISKLILTSSSSKPYQRIEVTTPYAWSNPSFRIPLKLFVLSLLYSINIALSNISMVYVSLSFHQLIRSTSPAFTVAIELLFLRKTHPKIIYFTLIPVILGMTLATVEGFSNIPQFTILGLIINVTGVIISCLKGIITNAILAGPDSLSPMEVLWRTATPSTIQCLILGALFGEISGVQKFFLTHSSDNATYIGPSIKEVFWKLFVNALLAMFLNWSSFTANQLTSALTINVVGNVKQVISILLAICFFDNRHHQLSWRQAIGIIIAISGGLWYSYHSIKLKSAKTFSRSLHCFEEHHPSIPMEQITTNTMNNTNVPLLCHPEAGLIQKAF